jgi:hypothetical protein
MLGSGKGTGKEDPPTDFNDCVSKNELQNFINAECNALDEKLNAIVQQITTFARRVEVVEQRQLVMMMRRRISEKRMLATPTSMPKHDVRATRVVEMHMTETHVIETHLIVRD